MGNVNVILSDLENSVLDELCLETDLSRSGVMRQALRMYQMIRIKRSKGLDLAFVDASGRVEKIVIVGLPALD